MPSRSLQASTWLLATLATLALDFARSEHVNSPGRLWAVTAVTWLLAVAAGYVMQRLGAPSKQAAGFVVLFLIVLTGLPFVSESSSRAWFSVGESPELVQLAALRNVMLGLAAAVLWPSTLRLSCVLSLFVALGALMYLYSWPGYVLIMLYGVVGIWWLMGSNWERMQGHLAASSRRELPFVAATSSTLIVVIVACSAALLVGGSRVSYALPGWFWGSGGTAQDDPFAARGIGNGEQLIAAQEEASSIGAVESELFLDSEMPSLYDMFNDLYGDEIKRTPETERSIALSPTINPPKHQHGTEDQQAGREFSTARRRRSPPPADAASNKATPPLIYVAGRVPLHLRLETFDRFDGRIWSHESKIEEPSRVAIALETRRTKPWLEIAHSGDSPAWRAAERHVVKVMRLSTNRIPTPAHPTGVHIDEVDEVEFYSWTQDDILSLPQRRTIPSLQIIHLESRSFDSELLDAGHQSNRENPSHSAISLPDGEDAVRITKLAREWTTGVAPGYPQVDAIVSKLTSGMFTKDPEYSLPANCEQAATHFLFQSQRGPDYLFATSAALLLRSLGYEARVASGLYARRERYDRIQRQTPVREDDVHFWTEVRLADSTWSTVEPTPGYETLSPLRTWSESVAIALQAIWKGMREHPLLSLSLLGLGIAAVRFRREACDALFTLVWRVRCRLSPHNQLLTTLWLIERRARLAGKGRPKFATLASWYQPLARAASSRAADVTRSLLAEIACALYSPQPSTTGDGASAAKRTSLCRDAADLLSLSAFCHMLAPPSTKTSKSR